MEYENIRTSFWKIVLVFADSQKYLLITVSAAVPGTWLILGFSYVLNFSCDLGATVNMWVVISNSTLQCGRSKGIASTFQQMFSGILTVITRKTSAEYFWRFKSEKKSFVMPRCIWIWHFTSGPHMNRNLHDTLLQYLREVGSYIAFSHQVLRDK